MSIFAIMLDDSVSAFVPETPALAASTDTYGRDVSCVEDLDAQAREVEGEEALAEAWTRRLSTPRGSLGEDDPDYGLDVMSFLHRKMTAAEVESIPGQIRSELQKDERTLEVQVRMIRYDDALRLECELDGYTAEGPFRLTLAATPANVAVLVKGEE